MPQSTTLDRPNLRLVEATGTPPSSDPIGSWEHEITELLGELSQVQDDIFHVMHQQREGLAGGDMEAVRELQPQQQELLDRLSDCQTRRAELLTRAEQEGRKADSLRALAAEVGLRGADSIASPFGRASARMELLQHQSLTNWVLIQRTLLHLSQMFEIIATGGQLYPTYDAGGPTNGKRGAAQPHGVLLDEAG